MILRSMLFIPGDSEKKLSKADGVAADAVILDLEDAVTAPRKDAARGMVGDFLKSRATADRKAKMYVRINPLESDAPLRDLAAVTSGVPDGIMLPKCSGPEEVRKISAYLDVLEMRDGIPPGFIKIVALAGESASGVLALGNYAKAPQSRLVGLTWGPWDLAADLGAGGNMDANGVYDFAYRMAMSMCLMGAKAAGLQAIDAPYTDFKDEAGLLAWCKSIRREGWTGKLAIHPAQVAIINEGFRPAAEEVAHAQRVVEAFATVKDGVVSLDGIMLDLPHLKQAKYILALRDADIARR
jgi:citrate lyase subunit beta/citryl-CoA lyase